jgi:hypothetical protein
MAQWSAQSTHNRLVTGSSPVRRTIQNNMNEIVNFLINFAVIYFLVRIAFTLFSWRLEKQIVHVESSVESQYMILDSRTHRQSVFLLRHRTKDFVCQGRDMARLFEIFNYVIQTDAV